MVAYTTYKHPDWDDGPEFTVIPTLHPMYLQYQGNPKTELRVIEDLQRAVAAVSGEIKDTTYTPNFRVTNTIAEFDEVMNEVEQTDFFSFDTEFRSLEWWDEPLISIQLCWGYPGGKTAVIPWYHTCEDNDPAILEPWNLKPCWTKEEKEHITGRLKKLFENPEIAKAAHNCLLGDMKVYST